MTELKEERQKAEERTSPRALIIFEAVRKEAEHELERPTNSLFFSGLGAGLSMGFSMVTQALFAGYLPEADWIHLISKFGYSIGFLIVILGRQQLFTENTLTPILHLLDKKTVPVLKNVGRLWGTVLLANIIGAAIFGLLIASSNHLFEPEVYDAMKYISFGLVSGTPLNVFYGAIFAGWLIALIIWLLPFSEQSRIWVIIIITYIIGLGHFSHIIAGSVDGFYGLFTGLISLHDFTFVFFLPTLLGNIVGGVALVAVVNYGQVFYEKMKT